MKNYKNIVASAILLSGPLLFVGTTNAAGPDSFLDIWVDASYDKTSDRPLVSGMASIRAPKAESSSSVEIVIESMNLMSHGPKEGPSRHIATIEYSVSNLGSSGDDTGGYMEVIMTCTGTREADSCGVDSSKPISKADHRGHITVLK